MSNLISIGRFSQIRRLSIKALRLYADLGLLYPEYVDPDSGYRYYGLRQAEIATRIRSLRSLEMPLEDIREVVRAGDSEVLRVLLEQHQERIAGQITKYQHILVLLQQLLENKEELVSYTIKVKEVLAQPIASIRMHIDPTTFGESISSAMIELIDYTEHLGVSYPTSGRRGLVSGLHRNSAYRFRRAALASLSDTSGRTDKTPVLIQSCRMSNVRKETFLAPMRSA